MKTLKIYFDKEKMVEFLNNVVSEDGSKIEVRELDEAVCLIRIADRLTLDKEKKSVQFKVTDRDKTKIRIGDAYMIVERYSLYSAIRSAFIDQLLNKQFASEYKSGSIGVDYQVHGDDTDIISVLETLHMI